jgi:amino-acid N-acetyltransferase
MLFQISPSGAPNVAPAIRGRGAASLVAMPTGPVEIGAVRVRHARISDMRAVEPLILRFASDNLMLPKSFDQLARTFREFLVATDESDRVVGCGALRIYTEGLAEICSLAVDQASHGHGIGRLLVEGLLAEARTLELETVFALTLRPEFFGRVGFSVVPKEDFPLKVWADCRNCTPATRSRWRSGSESRRAPDRNHNHFQ